MKVDLLKLSFTRKLFLSERLLFVTTLLGYFLLVACTKNIPKQVLTPTKMEDVLYDYHIAQAMANELPYEEVFKRNFYIEYVFRKHYITQATFDSSMVWYTRHADKLTKINENVTKRLKDRQNILNHEIALREDKPKTTQPGDTVDIWYGSRFHRLSTALATNKIKFSIPADTNFKIQDKIIWKVRYNFLSDKKKSVPAAMMAMNILFENDSLISSIKRINHSGIDSLVLKSDSAYKIKGIEGFIYYKDTVNDFSRELLLNKISLIRYHISDKDSIEIAGGSLQESTEKPDIESKKEKNKEKTLQRNVRLNDSLAERNSDTIIYERKGLRKIDAVRRIP